MTTAPETPALLWLDQARAKLDSTALGARTEEIGRVEEVGDGIALISGLPHARLDELLRFDNGQFGFVQVLNEDRLGCVLLDDGDAVNAGDIVRGTADVVRVPVGPALLGRIVDPLGRPLDGQGPISAAAQERARARIATAFGAHPHIRFRVDPALRQGLELHGPDIIIANSWHADLARILADITNDDRT